MVVVLVVVAAVVVVVVVAVSGVAAIVVIVVGVVGVAASILTSFLMVEVPKPPTLLIEPLMPRYFNHFLSFASSVSGSGRLGGDAVGVGSRKKLPDTALHSRRGSTTNR